MSGRGGGNKRKAEGGGRGGGKKKYISRAAPGNKATIPLGSRGILVSCTTSKEQQAGREAVDLFTEAYEELGGTWKRGAAAGGAPAAAAADGPPADIAAALAAEVAELRDTDKQALYYHPIGLHSVVYLELRDGEGPSPTQLVQHVCAAADAARTCRTRFCNRFYPIDRTCFASMEKIGEAAAAVVGEHFPADAAEGVEFAVQYDARAAPSLDRMEVINAFANLVPKPHKVNLSAPQKSILVNLVKGTCGISVVDKYKELCRFNIRTLAMSDEEREAQRAAAPDSKPKPAPAAPAKAEPAGEAAPAAAAGEEQQQEQAEAEEAAT